MTDEELKAIEALWRQEPKTGLPDLLVDVVPELVTEVRRLKALMKEAEWADDNNGDVIGPRCPFCLTEKNLYDGTHNRQCAAFMPNGEVK